MIRIISGLLIEVFSAFFMIGIVIGYSEDSLSVNISLIIFNLVLVVIGGLSIYFGLKKLKDRENVLNIAIATFRESGLIDYERIRKEFKINEYKARKYVLWGYKKKMFFEINQNGITQPKDLLNKL